MSKRVKLRIEEYVPLGQIIARHFARDRGELSIQFSEFTEDWQADFEAQIKKVSVLELTMPPTEIRKKVMAELYAAAKELYSELNFAKFYFQNAKLATNGISEAKWELRKDRFESACDHTDALLLYMRQNAGLLEIRGMARAFPSMLEHTRNRLSNKIAQQESVNALYQELYDQHAEEYRKLYGLISLIEAAGRVVYSSKQKQEEYIVKKLVAQLRIRKKDALVNQSTVPPSD